MHGRKGAGGRRSKHGSSQRGQQQKGSQPQPENLLPTQQQQQQQQQQPTSEPLIVDNSRSRLLQLPSSLLGVVFSFLESAEDRRSFLSISRDARCEDVLSQITTLDVELGQDLPDKLCFPKGSKCLSLSLLGDEGTKTGKRLSEVLGSWRKCGQAKSVLSNVQELNIVECDMEQNAPSVALAKDITILCPKMTSLSVCRTIVHPQFFKVLAGAKSLTDLHVCHSNVDSVASSHIRNAIPSLTAVSLHVCGDTAQLAGLAGIGPKLLSLQIGHVKQEGAYCLEIVLHSCTNLQCVQIDSLLPPQGMSWSSVSLQQLNFAALNLNILPDLLTSDLPNLKSIKADVFLIDALIDDSEVEEFVSKLRPHVGKLESLPIKNISGVLLAGSSIESMKAKHLTQALEVLQPTHFLHQVHSVKMFNMQFGAGSVHGATTSLSSLMPEVHSLWFGKSLLYGSTLVEAVQGFPKLVHLDVADKKEGFVLHHDKVIAACTVAQLSQREQHLKVRLIVRRGRSFGGDASESEEDEEDPDAGKFTMADIMPQCLLLMHWDEVAAALGPGPHKVQILLDAPTTSLNHVICTE